MGIRLFQAESPAAPPAVATLPPGWLEAHEMPALVASDLWFSYDKRGCVLQGVDLTVERGTMAMVLGRSGSGKTTLLRVLAGLLAPQRGTVQIAAPHGLSGHGGQARIAYIPQTLGLVRTMSALENTLSGALRRTNTVLSLFRLFGKETVQRGQATLERLGLGHKMHEQVYNLSGGERQRVAIARALMQEPSLILADEFVSQLDPVTTEEILEMMRGVAKGGVSLLITTHETDVVAGHADSLVVMRDGKASHTSDVRTLSQAAMRELLR